MFMRMLLLLIVVVLSACSSEPMPEALQAIKKAEQTSDFYFFAANNNPAGLCYIFYPGGRVKPEAYAPYLKQLSEHGVHGFLLRPLLEMAFLNTGVADKARHSEWAKNHCQQFYIGGHSFGGLATVSYGSDNPFYPLLIIGSYIHTEGLEDYPRPVSFIYGTEDLMVVNDIEANKAKAPPQTIYKPIVGGNHAQMGYYGEQDGDGVARISRREQQDQLVSLTLEFIQHSKD